MTITDLCAELKNYFDRARYFGKFKIEDGSIDLSEMVADGTMVNGQYFRIVGSVFNDGVYQYPTSALTDEIFDGAVWGMAVPPSVISLLIDINDWVDKYSDVINSPYTSESFGGYSYTKASGSGSSGSGDTLTWQDHFASRLNRWRKIRP